LTYSLRVKYNKTFDEYDEDILRLKDTIRDLEDELDHAKGLLDDQRMKRPCTREPLPPPEMTQRNLYMAAASRPAAPCIVPPQIRDADVEMKAAYPPLPTLPPLKYQALAP
jgi:hypothetical protein